MGAKFNSYYIKFFVKYFINISWNTTAKSTILQKIVFTKYFSPNIPFQTNILSLSIIKKYILIFINLQLQATFYQILTLTFFIYSKLVHACIECYTHFLKLNCFQNILKALKTNECVFLKRLSYVSTCLLIIAAHIWVKICVARTLIQTNLGYSKVLWNPRQDSQQTLALLL